MLAMNKDDILFRVAENLRLARLNKHYTQDYLAELAGITQKYLNMIENKKVNPSIAIVVNLCDVLNIDLNSLLKDI